MPEVRLAAIAAAAYQKYVPWIGRPPAPMTADYAQADDRARALGLPEIRLCTNADMTENLAYYPATATQKPTVPTRTASNASSPQARQLTSQL